MTERKHHICVGLTTLLGLAGVVVLVLLFGSVPKWLEGGYIIRIQLAHVGGLNDGSRVKLSGIDIGRVASVHLLQAPKQGVEVVTLIRQDVRVPQKVSAKGNSPLLGGSPSLSFDISQLSAQELEQWLPMDGSAVIRGETLSMASKFAGELEAAISGPAAQISKVADSFERLTDQWVQVGANVERLIEMQSVDQVDLGQKPGNLTTVLARTDKRLSELQAVIDGLSSWVNDTQLHENVLQASANAKQITEQLSVSIDQLTRRYVAVADDLSGVMESMQQVVMRANRDEGTLGKLLQDPALYDNLTDAVQRMTQAVDEVVLLVKKWKAEGLPVQF